MTTKQRNLLLRELGQKLKLPYPMEFADMLEESLEIYRRNFVVLFSLALIPALLGTIFGTIGNLGSFMPTVVGGEAILIAAMGLVYFLFVLTAVIGYGAQIWAAGQAITGRQVSFGEAWMAVLKRLGALILTMFIALFPTLMGLALCCVGVLFTAIIFFAVLEQIILLEGLAYFRAIRRHLELVFPNWEWARVLIFYLATSLLVTAVTILIGWGGIVFWVLGIELGQEVFPLPTRISLLVIGQLWQQLANALVAPYWSVLVTLLYFDLRARREAQDLRILVERWESLGR